MGHFSAEALEKFRYQFTPFAAERLKLLLETKHLYQKLSIEPKEILAKLREGLASMVGEKGEFDRFVGKVLSGRLALADKQLFDASGQIPIVCLIVGNVKLFCSKCNTREAFRPIWFSEITQSLLENQLHPLAPITQDRSAKYKIAFRATFQLFSLVYQCQHCEGHPEVFLVKRDGLDLSIDGRSPIEHVELPSFIPKEEKHWFRDAVVAFQSGKILAGLFYLRTFIEQFARRKTNTQNDKKTGDEILSAYAKTISENLRETMPSLAEWYDKLSAALHTAKEDSELFESAREKIEEHFDIRRVHKLDAKVADAVE